MRERERERVSVCAWKFNCGWFLLQSMMAMNTSLLHEIGPDGLAREAPVIAYTEKIIEEEQLQLRKYIQENYTKIRDVERELSNLTLEMKLTAGPKKAALEHLRKKIEISAEKIHVAKNKEEQARKALEAASKALKDEEETKQKLCEDLNRLVQESSNEQFSRLEELKRRLEALNPCRVSAAIFPEIVPAQNLKASSVPHTAEAASGEMKNMPNQGNRGIDKVMNGNDNQLPSFEGEEMGKKKTRTQGRGRGIGAVPKGRGSGGSGWTGAGFDVDRN